MKDIEGRKAIVLVSSGIDTFSKLTYDKARKVLQNDAVPVYAIGLLQTARELADARGGMGAIARMDFLQADNQMKTFAKETGGMAFFPRFQGEFPGIFPDDLSILAQPVFACLQSKQSKTGRHFSEDQS